MNKNANDETKDFFPINGKCLTKNLIYKAIESNIAKKRNK